LFSNPNSTAEIIEIEKEKNNNEMGDDILENKIKGKIKSS